MGMVGIDGFIKTSTYSGLASHRAMSLDPWTCDHDMVSTKNLLPYYTYYV